MYVSENRRDRGNIEMSKLLLIAGPCVIESEENMMLIAEKVKGIAVGLNLIIILKLRLIRQIEQVLIHFVGQVLKKDCSFSKK